MVAEELGECGRIGEPLYLQKGNHFIISERPNGIEYVKIAKLDTCMEFVKLISATTGYDFALKMAHLILLYCYKL